jgi:hypothetical protein
MNLEKPTNNEERKSAKYKSFPDAAPGTWGAEIREKHPDRLHDAILARIKHVSGRIDQYLPPYDKHYGVDQALALELENSFDELSQLYLQYAREGYGKYFYPEDKDGKYSFDIIKAFDQRLEKIHSLIINSEKPFFDEKQGKILVDKEGKTIEGTVGDGYKELSEEEKKTLHEKGISMLKEALDKIITLKTALESRLPIAP